jgi:hypothetical protein
VAHQVPTTLSVISVRESLHSLAHDLAQEVLVLGNQRFKG